MKTTTNPLDQAKKALRDAMSAKRREMPAGQHQTESKKICDGLIGLVENKSFRIIHTFIPMGNEPDLCPFIEYLLQKKYLVISSKTGKKRQLTHLVLESLEDLSAGLWGTKHPASEKEYHGDLDLIVVPGLAFDRRLGRLGYGRGYYDSFLAKHPNAHKTGVGFSYQLIENVPMDGHDMRLDSLLIA